MDGFSRRGCWWSVVPSYRFGLLLLLILVVCAPLQSLVFWGHLYNAK